MVVLWRQHTYLRGKCIKQQLNLCKNYDVTQTYLHISFSRQLYKLQCIIHLLEGRKEKQFSTNLNEMVPSYPWLFMWSICLSIHKI